MSAHNSAVSDCAAIPTNLSPTTSRTAFMLVAIIAFAGAGIAANPHTTAFAIHQDGASLIQLLRFMAVVKTAMAACAIAAVLWRLALPIALPRFAAYAAAGAAMAAGPVLIWTLTHIATGAILLHGGLAASLLLLWRDPATAARLTQALAARRR